MRNYAVRLLLLLSSVCFGATVFAASVDQEKQKLNALKSSLSQEEATLKELQAELEDYPSRINEAQAELQNAEAELAEAQSALTQLKIAANAGADKSREISMQEHTIRMAERRVRNETRGMDRVKRYETNLTDDLQKAEAAVSRLRNQIAAQTREVAAAEAAASRPTPPPVAAAVPKPAPVAPPKPVAKPVEPTPEPTVAAAPMPKKPEPRDTLPTPSAQPAANPASLSATDREGLETARDQMAMVNEISRSSGDDPFFSRLTLTGNKMNGYSEFEYLGEGQYRTESTVEAGRQLFKVNNQRFRVSIPADDQGQTYVFFVDASKPQRLRLTYFKKSLLDLL